MQTISLVSRHKLKRWNNYRPIRLTRIPCKILGRLLKKRILVHLETYMLVSPHQHGFRSNYSCVTNVRSQFRHGQCVRYYIRSVHYKKWCASRVPAFSVFSSILLLMSITDDCLNNAPEFGVDLIPGGELTDLAYADDKVLLFDDFSTACSSY